MFFKRILVKGIGGSNIGENFEHFSLRLKTFLLQKYVEF